MCHTQVKEYSHLECEQLIADNRPDEVMLRWSEIRKMRDSGWLNFMYILIHINAGTGFLHQGQSGADMWEKIHWKENDVLQKNLVPAALICAGQKDIIIKTILILPENLVSLIYIQQKEEWTFPKMAHWKLDESVLRNVSTPDGWNDAFYCTTFFFYSLLALHKGPRLPNN